MSTNHTPNFNLCQWEANDKVLRSDFNADNQKIDAALKACGFAVGSYNGTNTSSGGGQDIDVGFQPSLVIIGCPGKGGGDYGTIITREKPAMYNDVPVAKITPAGFHVQCASFDNRVVTPYTDFGGPYVYIAFR